MKNTFLFIAIAMLVFSASVFAADDVKQNAGEAISAPPSIQTDQPVFIPMSSKVPFKFYGFISGEFLATDSQLSTFGTLNNTPASYNRQIAGVNRVVDETVDGKNDGGISATVQNTRFGFLLDPYDFGGKNFSIDARLEMDFFSATNTAVASAAPRIRRAYAGIGMENWRVLAGQEWDAFSPLNTATLNLGGNLWQQGNLGFRRPQLRLTYNHKLDEERGVEAVGSLNLPSNSMALNDAGNDTGVPMFEGRAGYWQTLPAGKMWLYLSGLYARHNNETAGVDAVNNWGLALSADVPVHRWAKFMGEFHYGYSLGSQLSLSSDTRRQKDIAAWGQITSAWLSWLETNVGYGVDTLDVDQVAANFVKRNQVGYANVMFKPVKVFVLGLEYNHLRTTYRDTGASQADVVLANVLFYF